MLSHFSHVQLFATLWTIACKDPLSMTRILVKSTRVGCHVLLQGSLPNPGIEPASLKSLALAGGFFTTGAAWKTPQ